MGHFTCINIRYQEICAINAHSGYSNKTAVKVIISMRSLVSIEQQSPRRPFDITNVKVSLHNTTVNGIQLELVVGAFFEGLSTLCVQVH